MVLTALQRWQLGDDDKDNDNGQEHSDAKEEAGDIDKPMYKKWWLGKLPFISSRPTSSEKTLQPKPKIQRFRIPAKVRKPLSTQQQKQQQYPIQACTPMPLFFKTMVFDEDNACDTNGATIPGTCNFGS
jgi:hypothetical protein